MDLTVSWYYILQSRPLDLCEGSTSSPDVLSPGYQGPHFSGLAVTNHQGSVAPVLPASGTNPLLQVASGMVLGNGLPSPSATLNGPVRYCGISDITNFCFYNCPF